MRYLIKKHKLIYILPEGKTYKPTGIAAVYHQPLFKAKRLVNMGIDIAPQFWIATAHEVNIEAGLSVALNLNIQIRKKNILSFNAGSGLHYFGMNTQQQAKGFIFCDQIFISYKRAFTFKKNKLAEIGFLTSYRHLSNLGISYPNHGINNIIVGLFFGRVF